MAYEQIDLRQVQVFPLETRRSKQSIQDIYLDPENPPPDPGIQLPTIESIAQRIRQARQNSAAVILAYGAHLVKNGLGPLVASLAQQGWITHLATNGAGTIHDWEYAYQGRSEEDVRRNVAMGRFGTWDETSRNIHLAVLVGAIDGLGYGEALGKFIAEQGCLIPSPSQLQEELTTWVQNPTDDESMPARAELLQTLTRFAIKPGPYRVEHRYGDFSLTARAFRLRVPLTVHPGIGYDIIYNHPMANGAALGRGAQIDYRVLARSVEQLDGGVFLSIGSAIMAPQVFEKTISIANNLRLSRNLDPICPFIAVNDLARVDWDWSRGEPPKENPAYYLRFCKSFARMGGQMVYVGGDNRLFLHTLYHALK